MRVICIGIVWSFSAGLCLSTETLHEVKQQKKNATLQILTPGRTKNKRLRLSLSEQVTVILKVQGKAPVSVTMPKVTDSREWREVRRQKEFSRRQIPGGQIERSNEFVLDPLCQPGTTELQINPLFYRNADGELIEVSWDPVKIEITSKVAVADVDDLQDELPVEEVPDPGTSDAARRLAEKAGGATAMLLIALAAWAIHRHSKKKKKEIPYDVRAMSGLSQLAEDVRAWREAGRSPEIVSTILRRFLERREHVPVTRKTTPELRELLDRCEDLSSEERGEFFELLERLDHLKYAGARADAQEALALIDHAKLWIKQVSTE